jgi:LmbE family N-acetylglucosaminyl deacetylase
MLSRAIIVFDPHPDDADWWTGGLTLLLTGRGETVIYVCLGETDESTRAEALASAAILGAERRFLECSLTEGNRRDIQLTVAELLREIDPAMIFIPPRTDYHREHILVSHLLHEMCHWSSRFNLGDFEAYTYDSTENREGVELYIDITTVMERHLDSLRCHHTFDRPTIPENTLIRTKQGRAMQLGAMVPVADPVPYAEGYRLLRGHPRTISTLPALLPEQFYFASDRVLAFLNTMP